MQLEPRAKIDDVVIIKVDKTYTKLMQVKIVDAHYDEKVDMWIYEFWCRGQGDSDYLSETYILKNLTTNVSYEE